MTTTELEAGPELDALVAKAIGDTGYRTIPYDYQGVVRIRVDVKYSTDWNAAMEAAEKAELFSTNKASIYKHQNCLWVVETASGMFRAGTTGPLAICRAILALKRK